MTKLRINDFLPSDCGWSWSDNTEVDGAWVDLRPEDAPGDRNILRVLDADGHERTLFYFPENIVLVKRERPC